LFTGAVYFEPFLNLLLCRTPADDPFLTFGSVAYLVSPYSNYLQTPITRVASLDWLEEILSK
jgi:hypothetical protein